MSDTVSWDDVKKRRPIDEDSVAEHAARMVLEERAYLLKELRGLQRATQADLAARMGLTQPSISAVEAGELEKSSLGTIKNYVEALGGTLEVHIRFEDKELLLDTRKNA